jgi:hypothetical protein
VLAAIDIHKAIFPAAVLEPGSGEVVEERFAAHRDQRLKALRGAGWSAGPRCARNVGAEENCMLPLRLPRDVLGSTGAAPCNDETPAGAEVCVGARPRGFEPLTFGSVDRRSIQLSYGRQWSERRV